MTDEERLALGMAVRRSILGDAHVDRAAAEQTPETAEFQSLLVRYAWGEIWTRPGLDHVTRRLLVLTATVALGHDDEFVLHVRAALAAGVPREAIVETLLQTAIYCGVPAANHAFRLAKPVFAEFSAP